MESSTMKILNQQIDSRDLYTSYRDCIAQLDKERAYTKQLSVILEPIKNIWEELFHWLFQEKGFQTWEKIADRYFSLLCLTSPRGFGKSTAIACIVQYLNQKLQNNTVGAGPGGAVLYFFFNQGDNKTTQTAGQCLLSLLYQLLSNKVFNGTNNQEKVRKCMAILHSIQDDCLNDKDDVHMEEAELEHPFWLQAHTCQIIDRTVAAISRLIIQIADLSGIPVYILIDAAESCYDCVTSELIATFKRIARAAPAIKVMFSVCDNLEIESLLANNYPPGNENISSGHSQPDSRTLSPPLLDIQIITMDRLKTEKDMLRFLEAKLAPLVNRREGIYIKPQDA